MDPQRVQHLTMMRPTVTPGGTSENRSWRQMSRSQSTESTSVWQVGQIADWGVIGSKTYATLLVNRRSSLSAMPLSCWPIWPSSLRVTAKCVLIS